MEKKLEVETAKKLLEEANQMNPGGWYEHSLVVGEVAGRIAKAIGEDEEKAKAFGYIHDVGRRVGRCQLKHIYEGYKYFFCYHCTNNIYKAFKSQRELEEFLNDELF